MVDLVMKAGTLSKGSWYPAKPQPETKLQVSNPKGYNKHKKNPAPKVEIIAPLKLEDVQEAYREFWKAKNVLLSKAQKYYRLNKQFLGLDKIDQELKGLK